MIHSFETLKELGVIRDYSNINKGDIVEIKTNSIIMKSLMRNALSREKDAMQERAQSIGCRIEEVPGKTYVQFRFK